MASQRISILRGFIVSVIGTGFSRILGAARDISISHYFGATAASDAFWIAFTIPNMFRRFVADEGLTGALVPAVARAEAEAGEAEARRLAGATLLAVIIASVLLCGLAMLFAPYIVLLFAYGFSANPEQFELTVTLTRWLLPFVVLVALVSYCEGLLNHRGHFFVPKIAPGLVSAGIALSAVLLTTSFDEPVMALVVGVLAGGVVHLLVCLVPLARLWGVPIPRLASLREPRFRAFLVEMGKVVIIGIFAQLNIMVLRLLASLLETGSVTHYWYANRIVDLAQGAVAVGVGSALLPVIAQDVANAEWDRFRDDFAQAVRLAALVLIPASALLLVLAVPVTSVLFLHGRFDADDVQRTALTLQMFVPFMLAIAGINIVKKVYFALEERNTLLLVGFIGLALTAAIGFELSGHMGVEGLGLALSLSATAQLVIYLLLLSRRLGAKISLSGLIGPLAKMALASLPAAAAAWGICRFGNWSLGPRHLPNLALLAGACVAAALIYGAIVWVFRVPELRDVIGRVRKKLGR